jgi:ribosome biogenesis protein BMS1
MLKYTPEHMHCLANIYAAQAPPNTGVLAVRSTAANQKVAACALASCLQINHPGPLP